MAQENSTRLDLPSLSDESQRLINQARAGDRAALGKMLEASRDYLKHAARGLLDEDVQAKLGVSDLVQETFLDAHENIRHFRGSSHRELVAWLRQILANNLLNHYRSFRHTQKRQISQETRLAPNDLAFDEPDQTPSQLSVRKEEERLLQKALETLSPEHQQVIRLRNQQGLSFVEIGERTGRSADAARMLWYRAFNGLSSRLQNLD